MTNQTVFITGASRGIGNAIAKKYIFENYNTVLVCKGDASRMKSLQETAADKGLFCTCSSCDVSSLKETERLFSFLKEKRISVDILVHNAGISYTGLLQDMTPEKWHEVINTNLSSAFYLCRQIIPDMIKKHRGKIVNISSVWGICGASCETAYSASKGGLNAFTMALAKELAPSGIQVNALACGAIDTEMNGHLSPEEKADLAEEIPAGRFGTPDEVAEIVFSLTGASSYLTGQIIKLDGGWI